MTDQVYYKLYDNMTKFDDIVTKSDHQEFGVGGKLENNMWGVREDCNIVRMPRLRILTAMLDCFKIVKLR